MEGAEKCGHWGEGDGWAPPVSGAYNLMVATETLGQTGGWGRRRKPWMWGGSPRSPKGSWESLALEGPARGGQDERGLWWVG